MEEKRKHDFGFGPCKICGIEFHKASKRSEICPFCVNITKRSSFIIFERDDFKCVYCGKSSIEDGVELHVDHIFPKSKYRFNHPINTITACRDCNYSKGSRELNRGVVERLWRRNIESNKKLKIGIEELTAIFDIKYAKKNKR